MSFEQQIYLTFIIIEVLLIMTQITPNNTQAIYSYPPNFQLAKKHRLANRIFKGIQPNTQSQQCECCERKVGIEEIPCQVCYDPLELAFLGPGVPLFFLFLKLSILLLVVFTIIFACFTIYANVTSKGCSNGSCENSIFNTLAIINKKDESVYLSLQNYLTLAFVIAGILVLQYFRLSFRKMMKECDECVDSPSDYSIILRRLPLGTTEREIQRLIDERRSFLRDGERRQTQNLKVVKIIMSYSLREYTNVKEQNLQNFKKAIKQNNYKSFKPKNLPDLTETSTIAVVVFQKQKSKNYFLQKANIFQRIGQFFCSACLPLSDYKVKDERISIERAPQPDDIVWQNSGITTGGAIIRRSVMTFIVIIALCVGGGIQYALDLAKKSSSSASEQNTLDIVSSVAITIFNVVIVAFIVFTTKKERNQTLTEYNTMLMFKISTFQFFNTGIFVVMSNIIADYQNFNLNKGICTQVSMIMILNAIVPNVSLFLLNYFEISGKVMRFLIQREIINCTQAEVNQEFKGPQAQIPFKYAYILKTLFLTAFYAPLVPIVVPISIIGLVLNYFIEKVLYGNCYSVPNMLSRMVNDTALQMLQYFLIIFVMGELCIYFYFYHYDVTQIPLNWQIPIYISLILACLNSALPMDSLNDALFPITESICSTQPYSSVQAKFEVTYEMTNPGYKTDRKRKMNADFHVFKAFFAPDQAQNATIQMTNFFNLAVGYESERLKNNIPLLGQTLSPNKEGPANENPKPNQPHVMPNLLNLNALKVNDTKKDPNNISFEKENPNSVENSLNNSFGAMLLPKAANPPQFPPSNMQNGSSLPQPNSFFGQNTQNPSVYPNIPQQIQQKQSPIAYPNMPLPAQNQQNINFYPNIQQNNPQMHNFNPIVPNRPMPMAINRRK